MPLLDLFRGSNQTSVNTKLMENFVKSGFIIRDTLVLNTVFSVAKTIHDSINALSLGEERRRASYLLSTFIFQVSFNKKLTLGGFWKRC